MVGFNCCQDKLSQYKIGGPSRPFIDHNLQIHLPNWDSQQKQSYLSHSPIYAHYVGSSPSFYLSPQINEFELRNAMIEAEHSYQAWKQMQQKLKKAAENWFK